MWKLLWTKEVSGYLDDNFGYANDVLLALKTFVQRGVPPSQRRVQKDQDNHVVTYFETNKHRVYYEQRQQQKTIIVIVVKPK